MSLIRKHGAVLQAWACLDLVINYSQFKCANFYENIFIIFLLNPSVYPHAN